MPDKTWELWLTAEHEPGTLAAALRELLTEKRESLSRYSVAHLYHSLHPLIAALGNPPVAAITYTELRTYADSLYLRYKPGTIKPIIGDIRQFFRWAKKRGKVKRNPAKRLKPPGRRVMVDAAESRAAPEGDVLRVVDHLAGQLSPLVYRDLFGNLCAAPVSDWSYERRLALRDLLIVVMLWETGARAGEIWRLSSRAMSEATAAPGPAYRVISTGKTSAAALWFTRSTAELWSIWKGVRPAGLSEYALVAWRENRPPSLMTTETISKMLARRCQRAGVKPFRAHALRHAKARRTAQAVGIAAASRLLGHSSLAVTAGYTEVDDSDLSAAVILTGLGKRLWS